MRSSREWTSERFYDAIYEEDPDPWASLGRDEFAFDALSEYGPPETLLDVGCGSGRTIEFFHKKWPETRCAGIDLSPKAISIAQERYPYAQWMAQEFLDAKIGAEVVLVMGVAEHFEELKSALKHLNNLTGKRAYIEVPNNLSYADSKDPGYRRLSSGREQMEWHLPRETWEKLLTDAGFEIEKRLVGGRSSWEFVWVLR